MKPVRVRFAPSPTGHLHIGGLRTALFNWLFARKEKGAFLVRIEDTDKVRSQESFTQSILASLSWAGLISDEPIIKQTERMDLYAQKIDYLLQNGKAYKCYCPAAPLATQEENYFKYDGKCRLGIGSAIAGAAYVVRIKLPLEQKTIEFNDLIRGPIVFETNQLDDFIIARSDGSPIYNFVVVVDDAQTGITHVIRGEDHISNTPKQIVLYQAFDWPIPYFAHLPLILGPTGARLSKRDAATAVSDYKSNGYLSDALCNYLVRLGWSHADQEIFERNEIVNLFTLDAVGKKGAIFDQAKLDWINGIYVRKELSSRLIELIECDVDSHFLDSIAQWPLETIYALINLYKERSKTLKELADDVRAVCAGIFILSQENKDRWLTPSCRTYLLDFVNSLEVLPDYSVDVLTFLGKDVAVRNGIKLVDLAQPVRLALTGKINGPGVFDLLILLGKKETIARIHAFLAHGQN